MLLERQLVRSLDRVSMACPGERVRLACFPGGGFGGEVLAVENHVHGLAVPVEFFHDAVAKESARPQCSLCWNCCHRSFGIGPMAWFAQHFVRARFRDAFKFAR